MASIKPARRATTLRGWRTGRSHLDAPVSAESAVPKPVPGHQVGGKTVDFGRAAGVRNIRPRTHVGPHGTGQLAKLANQMIVGVTIGAVAEALLLCQKGGADMAKVKQAITGGSADSRILQVHGQRMIGRDFAARSRISVQLKDMRNALATAEEIGFDAPVTALAEKLYSDAVEHGLADLDHAGLFVELASRNAIQ
jgi:2-hydroxy-3-oxopropionate reductase